MKPAAAPFGPDDDLRGKDLRRARLAGCDLRRRDLSGADLERADLRRALLADARLEKARLRGARLRQADLSGVDLSGADLGEADLTGADLSGAVLGGATLGGALLEGACLDGASLDGCDLAGLSFRGVTMRRADLARANLERAQLSDGELESADLSQARLDDADLSFADLRGAILAGASLQRANLSGADLERADLRGAEVKGARLSWVLGLDHGSKRELQRRGARVPMPWLAGPWGRLNDLARRQAGPLYLTSLFVVAGIATLTAWWAADRMAGRRVYPLAPRSEGLVHEVDCGTPGDKEFSGTAGYIGGKRVVVKRPPINPPPDTYLTERSGDELGYRFHVSPGWYELQLHFIELDRRPKGARTFDIVVEGHVVARSFDILAEAHVATPLVRRWAVRVDDGFLDLHLKRRRGIAKVNLIRVRRMARPDTHPFLSGRTE